MPMSLGDVAADLLRISQDDEVGGDQCQHREQVADTRYRKRVRGETHRLRVRPATLEEKTDQAGSSPSTPNRFATGLAFTPGCQPNLRSTPAIVSTI